VLRDGRRSRPWLADVAQLVAHHLAKVRVAGSNPVIRSKAVVSTPAVEWPSGEATACKAVHTGSIPVSTSISSTQARLAQRESASLTRKRSLVQSQYRAPVFAQLKHGFCIKISGPCDLGTRMIRALGRERNPVHSAPGQALHRWTVRPRGPRTAHPRDAGVHATAARDGGTYRLRRGLGGPVRSVCAVASRPSSSG
jgi:hypothetical protein